MKEKLFVVTYDHLWYEKWGVGCTLLGVYKTDDEVQEAIDRKIKEIRIEYVSSRYDKEKEHLRDCFHIKEVIVGEDTDTYMAHYIE